MGQSQDGGYAPTVETWQDPDRNGAIRGKLLQRHGRDADPVRQDVATGRPLVVAEIPAAIDPLRLLVADAEILVRAEDESRATPILRGLGFDEAEPAACPGRDGPRLPVVVFARRGSGIMTGDLVAAVDALLGEKIDASFNNVLPDNSRKLGLTGPVFVESAAARPALGARAAAIDAEAGAGVVVAVIDTGIWGGSTDRANDPVSADSLLAGIPVTKDNRDELNTINGGGNAPLDMGAGHGTFVAGTIRQIAPKADVRVYRALDTDGIGTELGVACKILEAVRDGARIINLSLGQESYRDRPPVALRAALELVPDDVIVIAAAGNLDDGHTSEELAQRAHWPAAFRRVVGVGGLDRGYGPAKWSKRGYWVDLSTFGESVVSTFVEGEAEPDPIAQDVPPRWEQGDLTPWARWTGTSFSAPQIAGLVAAGISKGQTDPQQALAELIRGSRWWEPLYGHVIETPLL